MLRLARPENRGCRIDDVFPSSKRHERNPFEAGAFPHNPKVGRSNPPHAMVGLHRSPKSPEKSQKRPLGVLLHEALLPTKTSQRLSVLQTHRIPLQHNGRTILILICAISIEKRIPEPLLFGEPSFQLRSRIHLRFLPPAPFNASYDVGVGLGPMLKIRRATIRTMRNRLLQIFESLHPGW